MSEPTTNGSSLVGTELKHYRVESILGKGGMGVVYQARDSRLDRPVALKVLSDALTGDAHFRRRFLQEARSASAVNHPAIAQIYDVDEVDGVTYMAMELVEGRTVGDLLLGRDLDLLRALDIAIQVSKGLSKAHEAGIVHRDIKSENIMVTRDGHAKILDFGLAKLLESVEGEGNPQDLTAMETVAKTRMGVVLGTVAYMSPEQARGRAVDSRSDIFSLGIVLHEMITGERPFAGDTVLDTMHAIAFDDTRPISEIRSDVPVSLQRAVSRCLAKDPEERYHSARDLAGDLVDARREVESGIFRDPPIGERIRDRVRSLRSQPPSSWAIWVSGGALILVLLVISVVFDREFPVGQLLAFGVLALLIYRRFRNRRGRLMKKFSGKLKKIPEVQLIARDGNQVIVHVDRAAAQTYELVNDQIEKINGKLFFGDPFEVSVKENPTAEERQARLESPGVIYVRPDVLERRG